MLIYTCRDFWTDIDRSDSGVGRVNDQFLDLFGLYQSIPSSIACMLCEDVKDSSAYIKLMVLDLWIFNACDAPQILLCQG